MLTQARSPQFVIGGGHGVVSGTTVMYRVGPPAIASRGLPVVASRAASNSVPTNGVDPFTKKVPKATPVSRPVLMAVRPIGPPPLRVTTYVGMLGIAVVVPVVET